MTPEREARTKHNYFLVKFKQYVDEKKFDEIKILLRRYWAVIFKTNFPYGRTVNEIRLALQYKMLHDDYIEYKIKMSPKFFARYCDAVNFNLNSICNRFETGIYDEKITKISIRRDKILRKKKLCGDIFTDEAR